MRLWTGSSCAVRVAVRDVPIRLELAAAVAKYGTADEAAEHYWRCFELAEHFDDKRTIIANLAELAKANGTQDRFLDRLRRLRSTQEDSKSLTLCLVDALRDLGNPSEARFELEKLAGSRPDDLDLLKMLAALGAERNDWAAAIAYQERVVALAPESHHIEDLARYHRVKGNVAAAEETLLRLVDTGDRDAFVSAIAHAIDQLAFPDAKRLAAAGLSRRPDDWRILFLAGTAQLATGDSRAAERSFRSGAVIASRSNAGHTLVQIRIPNSKPFIVVDKTASCVVIAQADRFGSPENEGQSAGTGRPPPAEPARRRPGGQARRPR